MAYKIIENLLDNVYNFRNRELYCFIDETSGEWKSTSWRGFLDKTEQIAMGLIDLGVRPGDMVAVCSPNCPQMLSLDYALFMIRAVSVPINHHESQHVFNHIMNLTEASVIFVGDSKQYDMAVRFVRSHPDNRLRKIVLIWEDEKTRGSYGDLGESIWTLMAQKDKPGLRDELDRRIEEGDSKDLASVVFTTGTTGMPKGVMLGHEQIDAGLEIHDRFLVNLNPGEVSLSYLPMSHIFEKTWLYMCVHRGLRIAFCYDPAKISYMLRAIKPHVMCCVPRFWEKLYTCYFEYYNRQGWLHRQLIRRAFHVGKMRNLYYRRTGRRIPWRVEREYRYWDKHVFSKLREQSGLLKPGIYPTAGSMLNDKIMGFFLKAGFDILLGYGLTETTASVAIFPFLNPVVGTVGNPLDGIKLKINDNGEVMVKGPTVMRGYYKAPEETRAAFDEDGYLHTGDVGFITGSGALVINGRLKEIYKTSTGKVIPPLLIENTLMESSLLERVVAVADARKYVTALVYPNMNELRRIAGEKHWQYSGDDELLSLGKTRELLMEEIEKRQKELADYMHVRNIGIMPRDLSVEAGELAVSGKVRRKVVRENFISIIDTLYPNEFIDADPLFVSHQPY